MTENELNRRLAETIPEYKPFVQNATFDGNILLSRFDKFVSKSFCLFSAQPDFDFQALENNLDQIKIALPALIRIFEKPLIHLKEIDEIVPIEAVKKIGSDTLFNAGVHSENWDGESVKTLRPRRLLTSKIEDDYSIYENRVFAYVIDRIISYLEHAKHRLSLLVFSCRNLNINLLDRTNHRNYYLALASLHSGYDQGFNIAYERAAKDYKAILSIERAIMPRLRYRVYRTNRGKFSGNQIRTTNILSMHKDYKVIGFLVNGFCSKSDKYVVPSKAEAKDFYTTYRKYCSSLLLFSILNWGYEADNDAECFIFTPSAEFNLGKSKLKLKTIQSDSSFAFLLEFSGNTRYKVLLIPYGSCSQSGLLRLPYADEKIFLCPFPDNDVNGISIRIDDLDSFRRLQQVLLRGKINSDGIFEECPFCQTNMTKIDGGHICGMCKTLIQEKTCFTDEKPYFATFISGFVPKPEDRAMSSDMSLLYHFRNITELTQTDEIICPRCGRVH